MTDTIERDPKIPSLQLRTRGTRSTWHLYFRLQGREHRPKIPAAGRRPARLGGCRAGVPAAACQAQALKIATQLAFVIAALAPVVLLLTLNVFAALP